MGRKRNKPIDADSDTSSLGEMAGDTEAGSMDSDSQSAGRSRGPGRRQNGSSIQGYFRRVLEEYPHWVLERSNEPIYQRWLADNPGYQEVPQSVKNGLSNVKSALRNKARTTEKKRGRGRPPKVHAETPFPVFTPAAPAPRKASDRFEALEGLEEQIDECLSIAKKLGKDTMQQVIHLLRRARNAVVLEMGE